ncbi:hypothetical protein [Leekyejoonella antrihumi]|uniref:Uncharacterized protein n=1 Tax=Leekyejoonella antrihumi TaxID=1660198 RepID=A0A563DYN5_9MICO|nr:hypothetical protein [Leekyejoonella antrihumi]TWP35082.1 hypothetical protein FGL98_15110 [Leekyejoonella antrihumi]
MDGQADWRVFVTGVRSVTHLVHIASYVRDLLTRARSVRVSYIGGGRFLGHATVTHDDVLRMLPDDDRLSINFLAGTACWDAEPGERLVYVAVGAPGLKAWVLLRRAYPRRHLHVVVTDEGIGTYGNWRTRRAAWRRQGGGEPWTSARALAVAGGGRLLTGERWAMYDEGASWAIDGRVAAEFTRHVGDVRPDRESRRVVMLTQPWVEIGVLSEAAYLDHIRSVARFVERDGRSLAVRPHPAELIDRYRRFDVLTGRMPAELDPEVVGCSAAVGGTSTALLNVAALYGLPATRVVVPGLEHLDAGLGASQRRLLATYLAEPQ